MTHYVYLIEAKGTHQIWTKIGNAADPEKRLRDLQTANPMKLKLAEQYEMYDQMHAEQIERALHRLFADKRTTGEWFACSPDQIRQGILAIRDLNGDMRPYWADEFTPVNGKLSANQMRRATWTGYLMLAFIFIAMIAGTAVSDAYLHSRLIAQQYESMMIAIACASLFGMALVLRGPSYDPPTNDEWLASRRRREVAWAYNIRFPKAPTPAQGSNGAKPNIQETKT